MIKGFKEFVTRGNAIDLAVGSSSVVAFGAVITSIVDGFINPLIALIFGQPDLIERLALHDQRRTVLVRPRSSTRYSPSSPIAAAIYFVVVVPLNALAARRAKDEPALDEAAEPHRDRAPHRDPRLPAVAEQVSARSRALGDGARQASRVAPCAGPAPSLPDPLAQLSGGAPRSPSACCAIARERGDSGPGPGDDRAARVHL